MFEIIRFRSDMLVQLVDHAGNDRSIVNAARISYNNNADNFTPEQNESLLRYLMDNKHGTPFEHNFLTYRVECPIFVAREWFRHRIGHSYNEFSTRYKEIEPVFYVPEPDRKLVKSGHPRNPTMEPGQDWQRRVVNSNHQLIAEQSWIAYKEMLSMGVASEVARNVLPMSIYTSFVDSLNLRSLFNFMEVRTSAAGSKPLQEIEDCAWQMFNLAGSIFPVACNLFEAGGFVAP